jgi:hypothetical protein
MSKKQATTSIVHSKSKKPKKEEAAPKFAGSISLQSETQNDITSSSLENTATTNEEYVKRNMPEKFRKPNYHKYPLLKDKLMEMLDGTYTAAQIVKSLKTTQQTLFKYKSLAQLETGLNLTTLEEKIHLKRNGKNINS